MKALKIILIVLAVLIVGGIVVAIIKNKSDSTSGGTGNCNKKQLDACYEKGYSDAQSYLDGEDGDFTAPKSCTGCQEQYDTGWTEGEGDLMYSAE